MNIGVFLLACCVSLTTALAQAFPYQDARTRVAEWSKEAVSISYAKPERKIEIPSPDGREKVLIQGVSLSVAMGGNRLRGTEDVGVSALAELLWSSDSIAFAITESFGGEVGDWHVTVYMIEKGVVQRLAVSNEVVKSFKSYYRCTEPEEPNIGAITWLNGSRDLLLVAQVPPHSSCPEMGKVRGYLVEVPTGQITKEFDEKELRDLFGGCLGSRFKKRK